MNIFSEKRTVVTHCMAYKALAFFVAGFFLFSASICFAFSAYAEVASSSTEKALGKSEAKRPQGEAQNGQSQMVSPSSLANGTRPISLSLPASQHKDSGYESGTAYVLQRLDSPERAQAIEEAKRIDAAAREAFAKSEACARGEGGEMISPPSPLALSPSTPHNGGTEDHAALAQTPLNAGQGASGSLQGGLEGQRPSSVSANRPRTMTEVMFNGVTGFMGMPGLQSNQYEQYDPNTDQGMGFHADGTARRADGATGDNAASSSFDGRRAAGYAAHGMGYGQGSSGGMGDINGYYGSGYEHITGANLRYGDLTYLGQSNRHSGGNGLFNIDDPQRYFMQRGLNYGMGMVNSAAEGMFLGVMESPYGGARPVLISWLIWMVA